MSWFIDSTIPIYAMGADSAWRPRCRAFLARAAAEHRPLHCSVEALQEVLFHRLRRTSREQALAEVAALESSVVAHDFSLDIWRSARQLVAESDLRGRDAIHAATALALGFTHIVSIDADFDGAPGLQRVNP
ncbi:MAG: type II toxin-antitoxin system VapC family toxin [Actinobacteria bacterium]|nr:type II toxin-antitoxin system VapC family toxin [Actinomycetota bacterium]